MVDHRAVAPTDYKRRDLGKLTSYMEHDEEATLHDRYGQEMDGEEVQRLINISGRHQMSRHIVLSPQNGDQLSRKQLHRTAKRTLRETLGKREGVEYAYAIHMNGGDRPHVHVAATGRGNRPGDPAWMDEEDLVELAETTHEHAAEAEKTHGHTKAAVRAHELTAEAERGREEIAEPAEAATQQALTEADRRIKTREERLEAEKQRHLEDEDEKERDYGHGL